MKAIKLFLLKVWAIVSAIKPEEALFSERLSSSINEEQAQKFISALDAEEQSL